MIYYIADMHFGHTKEKTPLWVQNARNAFRVPGICYLPYTQRSTSSPFSVSTVIVEPGWTLPSKIFFASSVSTVCCTYRRSGRAPNCGS